MAKLDLRFPILGRVDTTAAAGQPDRSAIAARNVRVRDGYTGRLRGASRPGMEKFNASAIGVGRIKALCSTTVDRSKIEFSYSAGSETTLWDTPTPSKKDCLDGKTDRQGNVYALDGNAGIVKFNSAGREILKIALPVAEPGHIVRALWVDEVDRIFAGVSEGGDVRTARVWCVLQLPGDGYQVLWTLEPGAYTEELRVYRGSQLVAAHNYPLENRARVLVYEQIAVAPVEATRIESVAYPINGMDVGPDGSVYTASPSVQRNSTDTYARPGHPNEAPGSAVHAPLVGWKPTDGVAAGDFVLHSWYDADDLSSLDTSDVEDAELENDKQVLRWRDKSGNGRHFFSGALFLTGDEGPRYRKQGIGGRPCLFFDNGAAARKHSLVTVGNASVDVTLAAQQQSAIPAYTGAMWCMFMVLRPTQDDDAGSSGPRVVFAHENESGSSDHVMFVNRDCAAALPSTYDKGMLSYHATTDVAPDDGNCAGADQARAFPFDDFGSPLVKGALLVTVLWDGGVDPADMTKTRCVVRVNGRPVDRFEGLAFSSTQPTWLGLAPASIFATGVNIERRFRGEIAEMLVVGRKDPTSLTEPKVLTHDKIDVGAADAAQTDTSMARIEAYLAYKWGLGSILRNNQGAEVGFGNYTHYYARNSSGGRLLGAPPKPGVGGTWAAGGDILNSFALVAKHDGQGALQWVANWATHPDGASPHGGFGYGVRVRKLEDEKTHVWTAGFQPANSNASIVADSTVDVRKLIDLGESYLGTQAAGAWRHVFAGGAQLGYEYPRMAPDKFGALFFPGYNTGGGTLRPLHVFQKDPDGSGNAQEITTYLLTAPADDCHAVALPPDALTPDYDGDLALELAERVYLFTVAGDGILEPADSVHAVRMVTSAALATGSPQEVVTLAVVEDDVRRITDAANVVVTGGTAAISSPSQYVQALRAGDDIVLVDGQRVLAYSLADETLAALESTSAGEVPPRAQLAMYWRHRLWLGRFHGAEGNYAASRLGNIRNWDMRISEQTSVQAFRGSLTRAGESEDSIVAMIPAWDDYAFLVGHSRILRITGDPMDQGQIHLVTDSMGGVFGDSWCRDDKGRVYMWGNKPPGLYELHDTGEPEPLTRHSLESSDFAGIDLATHRIVLVWNPIDRGIHILRVAWGAPAATPVDHWFYELGAGVARLAPIWTDRFYDEEKQPSAACYLGGDETRGLLFGGYDGYVRSWTPTAETDDGDPIDSFATWRITPGGGPRAEYLLRSLQLALASEGGGCRLNLFASETADSIGPIQSAHDVEAGLNESIRARLRGAHLFVQMRSARARRFAFEGGVADVESRGAPVPRSP